MVSLIAKDVKLSYNVRARTDARPATRTTTHLLEGVAHADSYSSQAARGSCCHGTASSLSTVQQAAHFLLAARNPRRPRPKQTRAHRRKCPSTTPTHHPAATGETACLYQDGPDAPGPAGKNGSELETSPHHSFNQRRGSRWHRELFRLYWKRKPKVAEETITLIRQMAQENRLWGAERIRGELLKLNWASGCASGPSRSI
jgi:hypothetical protein